MYIVADEREMRKHIIYDEPEDSAAEDACLAETELDKTLDSESGPFNSVLK